MSDTDEIRNLEEDVIVKRGGEYDHATDGRVTVTGIWQGVRQVDRARNTNDTGVIIVRYTTNQHEEVVEEDERIETLDEFLVAIE
ncbi:hypothetical protein [Haloterrigena alkaliphila]|uniref:Uncharacterized protein n=1 Tax=Haloterrigena alkaliphila TaxID=2816475 RepID=A0A8A2VES9_9EURY|nr:hypothetical protein [Haloterrigena alkaliphila]QSW98924.1 hypothetical protein J0X25_16295 [Haloterrigena alkaliphila]